MDTIFDETLPMQMTNCSEKANQKMLFVCCFKAINKHFRRLILTLCVAEIYKMIPMSFVMNLLSSITMSGLDILINKNDKRQRRKCFRRE
ncbi:hypothetical protein T4D_9004 [Trichinella pseudospiralis]|uniref:Uncharacterized protein n=1 Tax=Trichinella pseudospiralis TaxID=6337 RepID=A0A0V1G3H7_TRIPS|nr:hypothetical protein T4D_9004 [Trichinella pseudospiralis]